ncbi:MAG: hypothetical protein QY326_02510 [Bdellovibrionota bacterium]|nr:MAG: hypothetical protein QY326_02510 [Bdellovibrionota bacterium]
MSCTDSKLERRRQLFSRSDQLLFEARGGTPDQTLPLIAEALIGSFVSPLSEGSILEDLKGRDPSGPCALELTAYAPAGPEELVALFGNVLLPQQKALRARQLAELPFEYRIRTKFDSFPHTHHINHRCTEQRPQSFPLWYTPLSTTRALPIMLTALRIGFEIFESRFSSLSFGFAPVVTSHILMEVSAEAWSLKLLTEVPRRASTVPVLSHEVLARMDRRLAAILSWSFASVIKNEL